MNSGLAGAHHELGLLLRQKGDLEAAAGEFSKAVEIDPHNEGSFLNLSEVLRRQGKLTEAEAAMEKFRNLRKQRDIDYRVQLYNEDGILSGEEGDLRRAVGYFQSAIELRPDNSEFRRNLAMAFFMKGELNESRRGWETAISLAPQDWQAYYGLGLVMAAEGDLKGSIKQLEWAVQLNPEYAEAYYLLSRVYGEAREEKKAQDALARALALDPGVGQRMKN
jgi:tetratricopeptide (TPR) repeat protein